MPSKKKKRKQTGQPYQVVENVLNRNFRAERPLQKLVTDITYLPFGPKQLYLSSVQDLFNGEIIAYSIGDCQNVEFVLDTLSQLPPLPEGCTLHSDQGSVYTSYAYQQKVKERGIIMSMSRKGTPADNASIESFHSILKSETFYLDELTCTTTAIVEQTVENYITYYNHIRIQTPFKQPVTGTIPKTGCLKGFLIPVSKSGVSPFTLEVFCTENMFYVD
jgi:putative transposase